MSEYRAYVLNNDGRILDRLDFDSQDDAAAKEQARKSAAGRDVEVWQGTRIIAKFEVNH